MTPFNQVTILGSGTSTGVPLIGCECHVCQSKDPSNQRFRASIFLEMKNKKRLIVDTTPDMRSQILQNGIKDLDGALITHVHSDHVAGIDDLRAFCFKYQGALPVFTSKESIDELTDKYSYIFDRQRAFKGRPILGGGLPELTLQEIKAGTHQILGEEFTLYELPHGHMKTLGFIHGKMGYFIDCISIPQEAIEKMRQIQIEWLIIDCVKRTPHQTHLHLHKALDYIRAVQPKNAGLTHLGHEFEHESLKAEMESIGLHYVKPLHDGQVIRYGA